MRTSCKCIALVAILLLIGPLCVASLRDIRTEGLPQESAVRKAYADVVTVEEFAREWTATWHYQKPKSEVASVLKASLAEFQKALATSPNNEELLLLTGLVAHYAYNLEVDGSYERAVQSLEKAHLLAPADYRPEWFLAVHQCKATLIKEGMESLLAIEARIPWDQLPASFWDDYMSCATVSNMPAHALRAGEHLGKLNAPYSESRAFLSDVARRRYKEPDPAATYSSNEVWYVNQAGQKKVFSNFMFGFAFSVPEDWRLSLPDVQNAQCVVLIKTGPHPGKSGDVIPTILVLARQAKPGESLADFMKTLLPSPSARPTGEAGCPSQDCLTFEIVKRGFYKGEGDARGLIRGVRRDAPAFPGLLLEEPMALPSTEGGKASYFHPVERFRHLPGTLYYEVLLDSASSVFERAKSDYEGFLKGFQTE